MTSNEFAFQVNRLERQFSRFGEERSRLLWLEVQDFSSSWFSKVIDRFISDFRQMPLLPDFREEMAKERERLWQEEKKQHTQDAKEFMASYGNDEIGVICENIRKRVSGNMADSEFGKFMRLISKEKL
jgi:hypothetical protein